LAVGEILDLSFRIYRATMVKCLPLAALGVIAAQLPNLYYVLSGRGLVRSLLTGIHTPLYDVLYVAGIVLAVVFDGAVLLRQFNLCSGRASGRELAATVRRLPGLIVFVVLFMLALAACLAPAFMFQSPVREGALLLLLLPAGYLAVAFSCALTVLLVAAAPALASFARSWQLTAGSFWRLSLVWFVALVILGVLYVLLGTVTALFSALIAHGDLAVVTATYAVVVVVLGALAVPFYSAVQLTVFGDLAARKEGADLAQRIAAAA
jgi:hypothetical protein